MTASMVHVTDLTPGSANPTQRLELKRNGTNINDRLRSSKGFRNPDFLKSVVDHFNINQHGTLFDEEVFDPKGYAEEDFYDALATAQRWGCGVRLVFQPLSV
jgi:hypothetical protein